MACDDTEFIKEGTFLMNAQGNLLTLNSLTPIKPQRETRHDTTRVFFSLMGSHFGHSQIFLHSYRKPLNIFVFKIKQK